MDLKLPVEDDEIFNTLKKMWEERGERSVYYSVQKAVGQEKWVSGRYKD